MGKQTATQTSKGKKSGRTGERSQASARHSAGSGPQADVLELQHAAGNRAVSQLLGAEGTNSPPTDDSHEHVQRSENKRLRPLPSANASAVDAKFAGVRKRNKRLGLQTELKVNEPGDIYEREADRIADQVMATPARPAVSGAPPRIQRFSGQSNGQVDAVPASVDQALASPGRPLDPALRQDMEQRFGHDFSRVRVHSGAAAEQSARDVNAHAYTVGHDIVFGAGQSAPGTQEERQLLAHELTHVVQQAGCGIASLQRKEKATDGSWSALAAAGERLSKASLRLYQLGPRSKGELLEIIKPKSEISALGTKHAVKTKVAHPMGGPSEKIESPFTDYSDLQETLRTFESSLVSHLRDGANVLLDATEKKLIDMSRQFVGTGPYPLDPQRSKIEGGRQHGPGWLEREIETVKKDRDIIKLEKDHQENKKAMYREVESSKPSILAIANYQAKLQEEEQQYNESLRQVVAKKSKLLFLPGFDVGDILHTKSSTIAQNKLIYYIARKGSQVREARKKLGDPRFLYGADILLETVKERLAERLGQDPKFNRSVVGEDPVLGPLAREEELSRRVKTLNFIVDGLARERKSASTLWEDIVKVLEVLSEFVPGPIGWGIRVGVAAASFDIKMGRPAEQGLLHGVGFSAVARDPNAASSAFAEAMSGVVPDSPLVKGAKPLTVGLEKTVGRSTVGEAANLGQRTATKSTTGSGTTAVREGKESLIKAADDVPSEQQLTHAAGGGRPASSSKALRGGKQTAVPLRNRGGGRGTDLPTSKAKPPKAAPKPPAPKAPTPKPVSTTSPKAEPLAAKPTPSKAKPSKAKTSKAKPSKAKPSKAKPPAKPKPTPKVKPAALKPAPKTTKPAARTTPPTARDAAKRFQANCSKCDQGPDTLNALEDIFQRTMSGKSTVTSHPGRYFPRHTRGAAGELDAIVKAQRDPNVVRIRVVPPKKGGGKKQRTPDLLVDVRLANRRIATQQREIRSLMPGVGIGPQHFGSVRTVVRTVAQDADAIAGAIRTKIFPPVGQSQIAGGGDLVVQIRRGGPNVDAKIASAVNKMNPRLVGAPFVRELHFHVPGPTRFGREVRYVRARNGTFVMAQ